MTGKDEDPMGRVPPPGPALLAAIADMRPVRPRRPARALAAIAAVASIHPAAAVLIKGPRPGLDRLPAAWVLGVAAIWAAGFALLLVRAVLPRPGDVLPDPARAMRATAGAALLFMALGLFGTVDVSPGPRLSSAPAWFHCLGFSLRTALPAAVAAHFFLRRLHPLGAWKIGAAIGGAGAALGGLALHLLCPAGDGLHVGFAHGGAVLVGAALGGLVLRSRVRA